MSWGAPSPALTSWGRSLLMPAAVGVGIVAVLVPLSPAYDLDVFLRAGQALLSGHSLYPKLGSTGVYSGSAFVYPYLAAWPFVPLALMPPAAAVAVFFALTFAAVTTSALAVSGRDAVRTALVLSASFGITGLQLGALSPLLFAGVLALWRLRERPAAFALLAGPVIAAKLFLAPLLVWPLLARRSRAFAGAASALTGLLAAGFVLGPLGPAAYARMLSSLGGHEARAGFGVIGALMRAGLSQRAAELVALALAAALVTAAQHRYRRRGDERVLFSAGVLASLALSPVLWSHYLILLAAPLLVLEAGIGWFALFALASWAIAPPHGVAFDVDPAGLARIILWVVLAVVVERSLGSAATV